ncbi:Rieske (2Fe-2S) protein [Chloroflexota bacterium]
MGHFVPVGKAGELGDGSLKKVLVSGKEILLARLGDSYYAADNRCPHLGGDLAQGKLEGTVVTCPRHGSQFDLSDGRAVRWLKGPGLLSTLGKLIKAPKPINTYKVTLEGDTIMVEI